MVNIKDIAADLGLSIATVSKALNNYNDVSEATRSRVRSSAQRLGYLPNANARALKTKRTYNLGVLFADEGHSGLTHPYFSRVLDSFRVSAEKRGFDLTFISHNIGKIDMTYLEHCRYRAVEGVCIACVDFFTTEVTELVKSEIPVVAIDETYSGVFNVISDNESDMSLLVSYILKQGHREVAYIHGQMRPVTKGRLTGFQKTMINMNVPMKSDYIVQGLYQDTALAAEKTRHLMSLPEPPTCIIYPDDTCAMAGIDALRAAGYDVPGDVSVAGYDGMESAMGTEPFLTTVLQDANEIGHQAAMLLVDRIEKPHSIIIQDKLVSGRFIPGKSIAKPRAGV